MYIRIYLDFCAVYHILSITNPFDSSINLNYLINTLERIQCHAALVITGTRREKPSTIYGELDWESSLSDELGWESSLSDELGWESSLSDELGWESSLSDELCWKSSLSDPRFYKYQNNLTTESSNSSRLNSSM